MILIAVLAGCVTVTLFEPDEDGRSAPQVPEKPRIFDHRIHVEEAELTCVECHLGNTEEELEDLEGSAAWLDREPTLPPAKSCFECHDPDESEDQEITSFYRELDAAGDGRPWETLLGFLELNFEHRIHVGKAELDCTECHSQVLDNQYLPGGVVAFKESCFQCHDDWSGQDDCSSCHQTFRRDVAPASHDYKNFLRAHGSGLDMAPLRSEKPVPHGDFGIDSCTFCHTEEECEDCHRETEPESHSPMFLENHGVMLLRSGDATSCTVCHQPSFCQDCHGEQRPRSHTQSFVRFNHALSASLDRSRCTTCHTQDFCQRCHESVEPRSHRGSFASRRQSHCISCHEPVRSTGCFTCHKSTAVHLQTATPMPDNPPHRTSIECKECHPRISHLDNGDGAACRACHKIR